MVTASHRIDPKQLTDVLKKHGISPDFHAQFQTLVDLGVVEDNRFKVRLEACLNYQEALQDLLTILSGPIAHLFAPKLEKAA